ncbi:MAG: hypothetical protein K2F97_00845 [Muribaculaceae bacterium]|nr:hypothetical protein [Muribaculaceae bacterium]
MSLRKTTVSLAAGCMLAACGAGAQSERIDAAEQSLHSGNIAAARRGVELVDTAGLSAAELCRMAVVYASVAEDSTGSETDVAMAARCIRRAIAKDSAAVDSFIRVMPVDQRPLMALVVQLCSAVDAGDIRSYEEPDSVLYHE